MIDSRPKIEERRVIKKEISEYAPTCALISCVLFFDMDILYKQFKLRTSIFVNHFEKAWMPSL